MGQQAQMSGIKEQFLFIIETDQQRCRTFTQICLWSHINTSGDRWMNSEKQKEENKDCVLGTTSQFTNVLLLTVVAIISHREIIVYQV